MIQSPDGAFSPTVPIGRTKVSVARTWFLRLMLVTVFVTNKLFVLKQIIKYLCCMAYFDKINVLCFVRRVIQGNRLGIIRLRNMHKLAGL